MKEPIKTLATLISLNAYLDTIGYNTDEIKENINLSKEELNQAFSLTDVGSSTKKTRADRRNKHAENVCREARFQLAKNGGIVDNNKISDLVIKWLNYGRKICYKPL